VGARRTIHVNGRSGTQAEGGRWEDSFREGGIRFLRVMRSQDERRGTSEPLSSSGVSLSVDEREISSYAARVEKKKKTYESFAGRHTRKEQPKSFTR